MISIDGASVFLSVPYERQGTGYTCGTACFVSLLGYYGYNPSEKDLVGRHVDGGRAGLFAGWVSCYYRVSGVGGSG